MKRSCLVTLVVGCLVVWSATNAVGISLEAALRKTIENNPDVQRAKYRLEEAAGRRLVFRAVALPDAVVGVAGGLQGGQRAGENSIQPFGFAYGNLLQPLFNAQIPASYRRGDVELLIAQQQLNVAVGERLHAARLAFYAGLYNRSLRVLRAEQRQQLEENISSQKDRYEAGLADRGTLASAQVQAHQLDPRVESAQRAYGTALLTLAEAMGDDLGPNAVLPELEGELIFAQVRVDPTTAATTALERRADLQLARLLVQAASEEQRIIEAAYYPAVNVVLAGEYIPGSGIRRESQGSPRRTDDIISSEVRAGVGYTWRVIDNGKVYGAALKQRQVREINKLELKKLEQGVPRELARIRNNLDAIVTKQKELTTATAAAEQNSVIIRQNLAGGLASPLEYRLIENTLLETKSALVSLAFQQKVALAEWDRATGRYLEFSDDSARNVH
jgi:outer membrane protein TolC